MPMERVQMALELRHRRDRHIRVPVIRDRGPNGAHASLEHPRRDEQVGTRLRMDARDRAQPLERGGRVGAVRAEEHALAVRGVRAHADVGRDGEVRHGLFHRVDRAWNDVVALARQHRRLVLPIGDAEEEEPGDPRRRGGARFPDELGDREALEPRGLGDPLAVLDRARHDHRQDGPGVQVGRAESTRPQGVLGEASAGEGVPHPPMVRSRRGAPPGGPRRYHGLQ